MRRKISLLAATAFDSNRGGVEALMVTFVLYEWSGTHQKKNDFFFFDLEREMSDVEEVELANLLTEAFDLLQKNGRIPNPQVPTALRAAGINLSEEQAGEVMRNTSDINSVEEYLILVKRHRKELPDSSDEIAGAFRVFDSNGDGTMSISEFRHIMCDMGERRLTEEEFAELVGSFNDGEKLRYVEYAKRMIAPFNELGNFDAAAAAT